MSITSLILLLCYNTVKTLSVGDKKALMIETKNVLLIEDDPGDANLIQDMLPKPQFKVKQAKRLTEAAHMLQTTAFDVILLDLSLPKSSGLGTFSTVYAQAPRLPIIVLTGLDDESVALDAMRTGAQDYLVKDQVTSPLLTRAIRYAIERKRTEEELRRHQDYLEELVQARTAEVEKVLGEVQNLNLRLQEEVTARQQATLALEAQNKALQASEEKHRNLVDHSPLGIGISRGNQIVFANPAMLDLFGYDSLEEFIQIPLLDYLTPEARLFIQTRMKQVARGEPVENCIKHDIIRKDGEIRTVELTTSSVVFNGELCRQGIFADITKREQMEEALQRSHQELQQFAHTVSHDLKEPLRMVIKFMSLLRQRLNGQLDEVAEEYIWYAKDGAQRMQALIQSLLEYAQIEASPQEATVIDCDQLLDQVLFNLQVMVEETNAHITRAPLPTLEGNAIQLGQVFQNLISNALKFQPLNGSPKEPEHIPHVHISAQTCMEKSGPVWKFAIRDNGIGIAPQQTPYVFEIFQRVHPRDTYPGSGVGLATCKKIVQSHGGRIWVESEPGQGSTFYFTLRAKNQE